MPETSIPNVFLQKQHAVFILEDGTRLTARLRISPRARRLRLALPADGPPRLSLPPEALPEAEKTLRNMLPWLEKAWKRRCLLQPRPELPAAVVIPLLPAKFAVRHAGNAARGRLAASLAPRGATALRHDGPGRLLLLENGGELLFYGDAPAARLPAAAALLRRWGRLTAERLLPPLLLRLAARERIPVETIRCRDQRSLWGSCRCVAAPGGALSARISLNWRAVLLTEELARHLCLHELCHVGRRGHSPDFHAALEACSPGSREKERALTRAWRELPWWARHAPAEGEAAGPCAPVPAP